MQGFDKPVLSSAEGLSPNGLQLTRFNGFPRSRRACRRANASNELIIEETRNAVLDLAFG
jgi:hypothetical protein